MGSSPDDDRPIPEFDIDSERTTGEVGSEGGSPGGVEIDLDREIGSGSETSETWRPAEHNTHDVVRDTREVVNESTGEGRRNPS